MRERFPEAEIIQDIGSGLNYTCKGLKALLERVLRGDKLTVVVAYRDRLARFGFELFEFLIKARSGEILVLEQVDLSPEQELTEDLLAILHVFLCRINGRCKYSHKKNQDLPKRDAESNSNALE